MFRIREKYGRLILLLAAAFFGALIGPIFMFGFVTLALEYNNQRIRLT